MSSKSYNRGSAQIREQIAHEYEELRHVRLSGMAIDPQLYDATMLAQAQTIEAQAEEIGTLQIRLGEAEEMIKLQQADLDLLRHDLEAARKHIAHLISWQGVYRTAMEGHKEKHHILSQVIRLGLAPERYHELRELVTKDG